MSTVASFADELLTLGAIVLVIVAAGVVVFTKDARKRRDRWRS